MSRVARIIGTVKKLCKTKADVDALVRANGHDYRTDRPTLTALDPEEKKQVWTFCQALRETLP